MTTLTLIPEARKLITFLNRGGAVANIWGTLDKKKESRWFTAGQPAALFNSTHNNYFSVHPCSAIPPTNSKGESVPPARVRSQVAYIAAINCLFGEFDAKKWVNVSDDEAEQEQRSGGGTLDEARARVQTRIFTQDPEHYKALALAHIEGLDVPPSVVIDSGGGYHAYWLFAEPYMLDDTNRQRAKYVQYAWVDRVRSDDDAKDLARVLRVPGTKNFKVDYAPNFPTVQVVWADYGLLYSFDELAALVPPEPATKERTSRRTRDATAPATSIGSDHDFDTIADAARNLGRLAAWRRDAYSEWIVVGMALRELGSIGYELWEKWSKLSSKYNPGDCAEKWPTFKAGDACDGITLASLARWAHDDNPEAAPPAVPEQVQRQLEEYKQEEAVRLKILKNPVLEDREKVAWLAMRNTLAVRMALRPDGTVRLSGEDVGRVMGRSEATGNRATRRLDQHQVLICDPVPVTTPDGREIMQMRVQPGPAFDNPDLLAPVADTKKRGGAREGAGRKPKCATCSPETPVIASTVKKVEYQCLGCGDVLHTETTPISAEVLTAEINIDFEDAGASEERPAPVAVAEPEIKVDYSPEASTQPEDAAGPEIKVESSTTNGYLACNSASGLADNNHSDYRKPPPDYPPGYAAGMFERLRHLAPAGGAL